MSKLVLDLGRMIEVARQQVAQAANAALTTLYWQLGKRVHTEILASRRAEYGAQIVAALGRQLGWSHFKLLIPIKEPIRRDFYAEMCRNPAATVIEIVEPPKRARPARAGLRPGELIWRGKVRSSNPRPPRRRK